jgi:hypothetical protein
MSIRLALGRYCEIMEAVQDESLKEQMVKVRESMDEEMLKAGAGIWNGVWYGMVISTWIWGFVLFDTMASVEGVGKGLVLLIGMIVCPFVLFVIFSFFMKYNKDALHGKEEILKEISLRPLSNKNGFIETFPDRASLVEMNGNFISSSPLHDVKHM